MNHVLSYTEKMLLNILREYLVCREMPDLFYSKSLNMPVIVFILIFCELFSKCVNSVSTYRVLTKIIYIITVT